MGGVTCDVYFDGMFIEWAWMDVALRNQGHGRMMIKAAEREGTRRETTFAHFDTFSFQAREFFEKIGYVVIGTLDYPRAGVQRFYMRRMLAAQPQ